MTVFHRMDLFELSLGQDGRLYDQMGMLFDVKDFSRYWHGQRDIGRQYGVMMARRFMSQYRDVCDSPGRIVVSGPHYDYLTRASHGVVETFCTVLNTHRVRLGLAPVRQLHVSPVSDVYDLAGARFVFIDDIDVSGDAESQMLFHIASCRPDEMYSLHVVNVDVHSVVANPSIDLAMIGAVRLRPAQLESRILSDNFRLNVQVFRAIIGWTKGELYHFLLHLNDTLLSELYAAVVGGEMANVIGGNPDAQYIFEDVLGRRGLGAMVDVR